MTGGVGYNECHADRRVLDLHAGSAEWDRGELAVGEFQVELGRAGKLRRVEYRGAGAQPGQPVSDADHRGDVVYGGERWDGLGFLSAGADAG